MLMFFGFKTERKWGRDGSARDASRACINLRGPYTHSNPYLSSASRQAPGVDPPGQSQRAAGPLRVSEARADDFGALDVGQDENPAPPLCLLIV